jgi:hypothetical protein
MDRPCVARLPVGVAVCAAKVIAMADPFTPDAFYASAQEFALSALETHHLSNHRRVPLFAGTAVEHLAKACLARRSPVLLVDLRNDSSFNWLAALLSVEGAGVPAGIRTVGLSEALKRMRRFVRSKASEDDLRTLIDMRNGVVHAAENTEVEERILTAFVQQADSLLEDLDRAREDFWGGQLPVVNALLADASNKLQHRVQVKLAAAEAMIERRYQTEGEAVISALRAFSKSGPLTAEQVFRDCPVCSSDGIATGWHNVWGYEPIRTGSPPECPSWMLRIGSVRGSAAQVSAGAIVKTCGSRSFRLLRAGPSHRAVR